MKQLNHTHSRAVTDALSNRRRRGSHEKELVDLQAQVFALTETLMHQKKSYAQALYEAQQEITNLRKLLLTEKAALTKEQCDFLLRNLQIPHREGRYGGVYLATTPPERVYDEHGICHGLHWLAPAIKHCLHRGPHNRRECTVCGSDDTWVSAGMGSTIRKICNSCGAERIFPDEEDV